MKDFGGELSNFVLVLSSLKKIRRQMLFGIASIFSQIIVLLSHISPSFVEYSKHKIDLIK